MRPWLLALPFVGLSVGAFAAVPDADLQITKTDGVTTAVPGGSVTYTITASNAGPGDSNGTVADTFPASLTANWTCLGVGGGACAGSGSGNINDTTVLLPSGASVTYTVTATISAAATGTLSNTATVAGTSGASDPNPANNSATDTDTITVPPSTDLRITKTDGLTTVNTNTVTTYTITTTNDGPTAVVDAHVRDPLGTTLASATWTCVGTGGGTCTASGSGSIDDAGVDLPVGASATWTLTATVISTSADVVNAASIFPGAGVVDSNTSNNGAVDTDTWVSLSDVSVSIDVSDATPGPGQGITYTLTMTNEGPDDAGLAVLDTTLPAGLIDVTMPGLTSGTPCFATGPDVTCIPLTLPVGVPQIIEIGGSVSADALDGDDLSMTVEVLGFPDTDPSNDTDTVIVTVEAPDTGDTADTADTADTVDIDDTADTGDGPGSCGCTAGGSPSIAGALLALGLAISRRPGRRGGRGSGRSGRRSRGSR